MNYTYLKNLIDKALCDIADLKNSVIKKIKIYFNDIEIESDTTSINFEGTGVENVETDDSGNVTITITGSDPIQSDWSETNVIDPSFIQNKPTPTDLIFTGNVSTTQTGPNEITVDVLSSSYTPPQQSFFVNTQLTDISPNYNISFVPQLNSIYRINLYLYVNTQNPSGINITLSGNLCLFSSNNIKNVGIVKIESSLLYTSFTNLVSTSVIYSYDNSNQNLEVSNLNIDGTILGGYEYSTPMSFLNFTINTSSIGGAYGIQLLAYTIEKL